LANIQIKDFKQPDTAEGLPMSPDNTKRSPSESLLAWLPPSPRALLPKLPFLAVKPLAGAPYPLQSLLLKTLLGRLFKVALTEGELAFLENKWLHIGITDAGINWYFSCDARHKVLTKQHGPSDVAIRGNLKSFALLAAQKEDPDSLFFQRDLVIEGDTDLGLSVKNLLDSLDWQTLPPEAVFVLRSGAEYMNLFAD
jgi:predicted lipid carrier protein YhbT